MEKGMYVLLHDKIGSDRSYEHEVRMVTAIQDEWFSVQMVPRPGRAIPNSPTCFERTPHLLRFDRYDYVECSKEIYSAFIADEPRSWEDRVRE
jgi:hypothetical protein